MKKNLRGFTMMEVVVVIAVLTILLSIVLASISEARESSRDKKRVSDLTNIAQALTLYKEKNRDYPVYPNGVEIGKGGALDTTLRELNGNVYTDPRTGETGYEYWYYSYFLCDGERHNVIIAKTMEKSTNSNFVEVCGSAVASAQENKNSDESKPWQFVPLVYAGHGGPSGGNSSAHGGGGGGGPGLGGGGSGYSQSSYGGSFACVVNSFTVTPTSLPYGGGVVSLAWNTSAVSGQNGITLSANPGGVLGTNLYNDRGTGGGTAPFETTVTNTTTFTISGNASNGGGCSGNVAVTVATTPPPPAYTQSAYAPPPTSTPGFDGSFIYILKQ